MSPEFPLRILFDDGECITIETPDDLLDAIDTIDSDDPTARLWIRDALDRTVHLRMRGGVVERLEA